MMDSDAGGGASLVASANKLYVGMIIMLVFSEPLILYGLIVALILSQHYLPEVQNSLCFHKFDAYRWKREREPCKLVDLHNAKTGYWVLLRYWLSSSTKAPVSRSPAGFPKNVRPDRVAGLLPAFLTSFTALDLVFSLLSWLVTNWYDLSTLYSIQMFDN